MATSVLLATIMTGVHITDIESAINYWRGKKPSPDGITLAPEVPDTPCIAICSTNQGDATCKGCGRSFEEVQHWTDMRPVEKRATWRRITQEGTSWRFNRYAERAVERQTVA